jgi:quinol monooxygenase YgiN
MSALCKKCDIPFTSENALKEHMKTTHPELLNFACETCKEKFLDEISYQNHIKNIHFQTAELNENTINVKKKIIGEPLKYL